MEVPSWAGKVATVAGLTNPITAPVVVGKWLAEKANSALGPKSEPPAAVAPQPQAPPQPQPAPLPSKPDYAENPHVTNGSEKLVGGDGKWDGAKILNGQSQYGGPGSQQEQENRCGPAAVLGQAVMSGPEATDKLAGKLAQANPKFKDDIEGIQQRLKARPSQATHEDLSKLQHMMYETYHTGDKPGMSAEALSKMQRELSGKVEENSAFSEVNGRKVTKNGNQVEEDGSQTYDRIDNLKPGQSFVKFVAHQGDGQNLDHFVVVGKDKDGKTYVYDPAPKTNQPQMFYSQGNEDAFDHYATNMGVLENGQQRQVMAGHITSN
ncbi:MAG: hypothetical protein KF760_08735 [Candidatus Eremiobacteraeota bacterium]|nr:hypothetical protein [Candidatus Eremiobacteraeota bacterium]MCW5870688.1 hypothetical protein [Candidatus Eremiobacteraeota bacterium]